MTLGAGNSCNQRTEASCRCNVDNPDFLHLQIFTRDPDMASKRARQRPAASASLLLPHLSEQLREYEGNMHASTLRDRVLRLIELQNSVRKLGVAIAVEEGYSPSSARDRIRSYLQAHAGNVIEGEELAAISGISEYARRVRELRNDEGFEILTGPDVNPGTNRPLRPDQYLLIDDPA